MAKIPNGFPFEEDRDKAKAYWLKAKKQELDVLEQAEKFRRYHEENGTNARSWPRTWATWYMKAVEYLGQKRASKGLKSAPSLEELSRMVEAGRRALKAEAEENRKWRERVETYRRGF